MLKINRIKNILFPKTKFHSDILWNGLSLVIMGISGIVLNILILIKYNVEILGAFNQVYAIYILISQLAVWGLYSSVLKHTSQHSDNESVCNQILTSSLILGVGITSIVTFLYYLIIPIFGYLLESINVELGLTFALLGLWCFSINKILLSFINGKRLMKAFSLFNSFRYLMLPLSLIVLILLNLPGYAVPLIFSLTEFILLIILLIFVLHFFSFASISECKKWFKIHLPFGVKSLLGGSIVEINSRVDILMLGFFLSDKVVGIYSFAAMLAEGFDQIPSIFRVNYNPLLTKLAIQRRLADLSLMIKIFIRKWLPFSLAFSFLIILGFPFVVRMFFSEMDLFKSWIVFAILIIGISLRSGYSVFWELPAQSGHPGYQTILISLVAVSNVVLNYFFILQWGIYGAAIATSFSFILGIFYLKLVINKILNIKI